MKYFWLSDNRTPHLFYDSKIRRRTSE